MKKTILYSIVALSVFGLTGVSQVSAFDGMGKGGMKGNKFGLISPEMHKEFKGDFKNLSKEEKDQLKADRVASKQKRQDDMAKFLGLTHDQIKEMRKDGSKMSDILAKQGITESQARTFLTDRMNTHADQVIARHDLTAEQAATLKDKIAQVVQNILNKWFNK